MDAFEVLAAVFGVLAGFWTIGFIAMMESSFTSIEAHAVVLERLSQRTA
jgi:hypothetical protein